MKKGFTLAEVLITLAVIGIVAALTIGVFLPKIHSTIRAHQIAVAETKFTKAMEQMALNNAIGPYYNTTQEFVDELQNYLKIAKVCTNDKLEECFGYEKIKLGGEDTIDVKSIKLPGNFGIKNNGTSKEYGETIGLVTIDGTAMILTWNTKCPILEPKVYQWNGNTNETTNCISMAFDINGNNDVNTYGKDVALFNADKLGSACGIEFEYDGVKYCWGTPFIADQRYTLEECEAKKDGLGVKECCQDCYMYSGGGDAWLYAVDKCGGVDNMLSMEDLAILGDYLLNLPANRRLNTSETRYSLHLDTSKIPAGIKLNGDAIQIWSSDELSDSAANSWKFGPTYAWPTGGVFRINNFFNAICKVD